MAQANQLAPNSALASSAPSRPRTTTLRQIATDGVCLVGARLVGAFTVLLIMPMTLAYLGTERNGTWLAITSFVALLGFADLGLGSGVLNAVAAAHGRRAIKELQSIIATGLIAISAIAAALLATTWLTFTLLASIPGSQWSLQSESTNTLLALLTLLFVGLPATLVSRIQLGLQNAFWNGLSEIISSVTTWLALWLVIQSGGSMVAMVVALLGIPLIVNLAHFALLLGYARPDLRPHNLSFDQTLARQLGKEAIQFFGLQLAVSLIFLSDQPLTYWMFGPEAVNLISFPLRLFGLQLTLLSLLQAPLWPAYRAAVARNDQRWVAKVAYCSLSATTFIAILANLSLILGYNTIHPLWTGQSSTIPTSVLVALAAWYAVQAVGASVSMLLNAYSRMQAQIIMSVLILATRFPLTCALGHTFGLPGMIWGSVLGYTAFGLIPSLLLASQILRPRQLPERHPT